MKIRSKADETKSEPNGPDDWQSADSQKATPDEIQVQIRTKAPQPMRLSRRVLFGAAAAVAAIVAASLVFGLGVQPDHAREVEAVAASGGPPQSIQAAPGQYEPTDLEGQSRFDEIGASGADGELRPPSSEIWRGPSPTSAPATASADREGPSVEDLARAAPILFERGAVDQARQSRDDESGRLQSRLHPPGSAYEVQAGAVIAAALFTELNSDAPGRVIAQVTQPVFDSVSGAHLLIPQGSRLIGSYDNDVNYGDRRLVLVWDRLILPNGWSLNLQQMQGADPAGAGGVRDRTDNHLGRLVGAVALSAIISVIANGAEDDDEDASLSQNLSDAAAQEAARSGARIVERELAVRPTLRVRAGAPVRVLVMRDIALRPYREAHVSARR